MTATHAWITVKLTFLWLVIQLRILIHLYISPKCQDFYLRWWPMVKEQIIDALRTVSFLSWNYKENPVRQYCMWTYFMSYTSLKEGLWENLPFYLKFSLLREDVIIHLGAHSGAESALLNTCWISKKRSSFLLFFYTVQTDRSSNVKKTQFPTQNTFWVFIISFSEVWFATLFTLSSSKNVSKKNNCSTDTGYKNI